jgi:oligopeptide/dipeptide ABC transporter ATP-binding protein
MNNVTNKNEPLLKVRHLKKYFTIPRKGQLHAVDNVDFEVYAGETLGLVGESGCGKSTVGNVVMRLLPKTDGELFYRNQDVFSARGQDSIELRKRMQIIFQDPYSSLNPRKTINSILSEAFIINNLGKGQELLNKVKNLCELVQIPENLLDHYPHELDGGMRQVVGIARALSLSADFVVCDEPVSSLDVSVQARIINLLMTLQKKLGLSYLFISHDLSVVRYISDRIAVMYLGQIVEMADSNIIFSNTLHPYSIALLSAVPVVNNTKKISRILLKGDVPSPLNPKPGCRFAPRCWMARENCFKDDPELREYEPGHSAACHYALESRELAKTAVTVSMKSIEK